MGNVWIKEFTGGLDTRRLAETTAGGVLIKARNVHLTRGGDVQKRAAFVPEYTLTEGTVGMAGGTDSIYVFGDAVAPELPENVKYQRLQHPDGVTSLTRVLSADLYAGKLYVVGEFDDGSIFHFYNGTRVADWYDGRARATFSIDAGGVAPAVSATGSFEVTGGTANVANQITAVTIDGVNLISGAVTHTGNNATTAAAVASAINSFSSSPDYTATSSGQLVIVTAATPGTAPNGKAIVTTVTGNFTTGNVTNMNGGAAASPAELTSIQVDGVPIIGSPIQWTTNAVDFAAAIANAINTYASVPEYTASAAGASVSIASTATGSAQNGKPVTFTTTNGLSVSPATGLVLTDGSAVVATSASGSLTVTGGTVGSSNKLTELKVNGVNIISSAVVHTGNNTTTAAAIASAINSATSSPEYSATSSGAVVTITAAAVGSTPNGYVIVPTVAGTFTVGSIVNFSGGVDPVYQPGSFVKTIGQKMYSTSGPNMHFSGIAQPTKWTTDTVGAGFIDMSSEASGAENLTALAKYQSNIAVFAERIIQIWYIDPDPTLNRQSQVLNNTGTLSPKSVTQFGDNDLFYLDESGLRSLRARDASNAAATNDIGVSIDSLIVEKLNELTLDERQNIIGLIEPRDGRFWLALKDTIFVFSYFPGSRISAWSTYEPTIVQGGEDVLFEIDDMVVFKRRVYVRSGNTIYVYGGLSNAVEYDETEAEAWLPFLDGNAPALEKNFTGLDAAVRGEWRVAAGMQPTAPAVEDHVATLTETTFNSGSIPAIGRSTHLSLRFRTRSASDAILSSAVIHYEGDQLEDK